MDFRQSKGRGFVPKRITPPRVGARLKTIVKQKRVAGKKQHKKG